MEEVRVRYRLRYHHFIRSLLPTITLQRERELRVYLLEQIDFLMQQIVKERATLFVQTLCFHVLQQNTKLVPS